MPLHCFKVLVTELVFDIYFDIYMNGTRLIRAFSILSHALVINEPGYRSVGVSGCKQSYMTS